MFQPFSAGARGFRGAVRAVSHPGGVALCLTLGYMTLCGAYIVYLDRVAASVVASPDELRDMEGLKAAIYVAVTGMVYFVFAAFLLRHMAIQQRHFADVFRSVPDPLFVLRMRADGACRIVSANAAFLAMTGLNDEQVMGKRIDDVLPEAVRSEIAERMNGAVCDGRSATWECSAAYPAGHRVGEVTLTPLVCRGGRVTQVAVAIRDTTAHHQAEDEVRQLSGHLLRLQDEERLRIGRELHDATGQELAAVAMNLGLVQLRVAERDPEAENLLADSQAIIENCQRELRTLSYRLHPPVLDDVGLAGAIREYAEGFTQRSGIRVTVEEGGDVGRLPADTERALFRVVQESLGNVHRHSRSTTATIRLRREESRVVLEVADQGQGLRMREDGTAAKAGVGLAGMRERVRQLGGRFEIESGAKGTTIRAVVPDPGQQDGSHEYPDRG